MSEVATFGVLLSPWLLAFGPKAPCRSTPPTPVVHRAHYRSIFFPSTPYRGTSLMRNRPPPLGPPKGTRHITTAGSYGGAVYYERDTPAGDPPPLHSTQDVLQAKSALMPPFSAPSFPPSSTHPHFRPAPTPLPLNPKPLTPSPQP